MFRQLLVILLVTGAVGGPGCAPPPDLRTRFTAQIWANDATLPPHVEKSAVDYLTPAPWLKGLKQALLRQ